MQRASRQYETDMDQLNYNLSDDPVFSLSRDARTKQIKSFVLWGLINVLIFFFILSIVVRFWT